MAVYFGNEKILDNGVAGTPLLLAHGETHASSGSDPLTPESIGAAPLDHIHAYAQQPATVSILLPQSGWTCYAYGCTQTVSVEGMRSSSLIIVASHPDYYDEFLAARVRCAVQGWGALTFSCKRLPIRDLTVNIMILG